MHRRYYLIRNYNTFLVQSDCYIDLIVLQKNLCLQKLKVMMIIQTSIRPLEQSVHNSIFGSYFVIVFHILA